MKNIVWTRIDERLIHGQVMATWVKYTDANEIVIVDNNLVKDTFTQTIMQSLIPSNIKLSVFGEEEASLYLKSDEGKTKIFILTKTPQPLLYLIDDGLPIKDINVGGMGMKSGRKTIYKTIATSPEENEIFRKLINKGINVYSQIVPTDKKVDLNQVLKDK